MTKGFPRMNSKQKEYCPSGYIWITNINYCPDRTLLGITENEFLNGIALTHGIVFPEYIDAIKKYREKYGDVMVTDAFDVLDRPLKHTDVAIYVLHPAFWRVQKTLRRLKAKRDIK